jgi:hypothetical protein
LSSPLIDVAQQDVDVVREWLAESQLAAFASARLKRSAFRQGFGATARKASRAGGKGIRTPDIQLAKLALYQLSYAPAEE